MKRALLAIAVALPFIAFAQGMIDVGHIAAICKCSYDCRSVGAQGGAIKATCVNYIDGGVCNFPASPSDGGIVGATLAFSFEGSCYHGPIVTERSYATLMGCAASACYYNPDGGTCSNTPIVGP
jgi:hypothetical protein